MSNYQLETCDQQYTRFSPFAPKWVATSGVMNQAESKGAYWVLDVIASYVRDLNRMNNLDYILTLEVKLNKTGNGCLFTISHEVDGESVVVIRQHIPFTDLDKNIKLWAINESGTNKYDGKHNTIVLLPSEY